MRQIIQRLRLLSFSLVFASQIGCGDPLKYGQDLAEDRVLGVRVESGDDGETGLRPFEEAKFSVLLAGPNGPFEVRLGYEICEALAADRGVPTCAVPYASGTTALSSLPELVVTPASDAQPGSAVAMLGVACKTGDPVLAFDPLKWSCVDGGEPLNFSFDAEIQGRGRTNHVPDLSQLLIHFGDAPVTLEAVDVPAHCGEDVVNISTDEIVSVAMFFGDTVREAFIDELDGPTLETIQISHFATGGRFERQFSIVDPDEKAETALEWVAPSVPGPVKVYAVVRDGFGGVNWASLSVCVE